MWRTDGGVRGKKCKYVFPTHHKHVTLTVASLAMIAGVSRLRGDRPLIIRQCGAPT
jgi:hypothetical protein